MATNGSSEEQPERPRPRPRGRPTRLTPMLADALVAAVRQTGFIKPAAARCGLADAVVQEWVRRGTGAHPTRPGTRPYADFAARIALARRGNGKPTPRRDRDGGDGETRHLGRRHVAARTLRSRELRPPRADRPTRASTP